MACLIKTSNNNALPSSLKRLPVMSKSSAAESPRLIPNIEIKTKRKREYYNSDFSQYDHP